MSQYTTYLTWKDWKAADFLKYSDIEKRGFELELGPYVHHPSVEKVLEIGFGNGTVLGWMKDCGKTVEGVEVNKELVARAESHGIVSHESVFDLPERSKYDLIIALDVLEHINASELENFFLKVASLLNEKGVFIARFPNGDSPFALPTQNGDLTHVTSIGWHRVSHLARVSLLQLTEYRGEKLYTHSRIMRILRIGILFVRYVVADFLLRLFFPRVPSGTVTFRHVNIVTVFVK